MVGKYISQCDIQYSRPEQNIGSNRESSNRRAGKWNRLLFLPKKIEDFNLLSHTAYNGCTLHSTHSFYSDYYSRFVQGRYIKLKVSVDNPLIGSSYFVLSGGWGLN